MAIGSGLGGSVGFAPEVTYGTYVAPSRFLEMAKAAPDRKPNFVQGGGIAAGRAFERASMWVQTHREGTLSCEGEVRNKGFGLLFAHLLGSSAVPVQQGATAAYLQSHVWGDNVGKSLTAQIGTPTLGGTVVPQTMLGCKVTDVELSCGLGELLTAKWDFDAQDYTALTALAAPSGLTGQRPFHFGQMAVKVGTFGAEAAQSGIRKVTVKISRPMRTDRQYAGGAGKKAEPVWNGRPSITGSIETDFLAQADFADRVATGLPVSFVWEFVGPVIAGANFETFRVTLSAAVFTAGDPTLDQGLDVVQPRFDFTAKWDDTNPPIKVELISVDTTL